MAGYFKRGVLGQEKSIRPYWTIPEDEDSQIEFFQDLRDSLADIQGELIEEDLRRRDFYLGQQSMSLGRDGIPRDREGRQLDKFSRVVMNKVYELVEQWVAKMTRYAPAIAVIPPNDEANDRIAAELSKQFIDFLFYVNDIDGILEECARACRLDGETYVFVEWDKNKGDKDPASQDASSLGIDKVPLLDQEGRPIFSQEGEPLMIDPDSTVGDVAFSHVLRRFVLVQPKEKWSEVEWVMKITSKDKDELKAEYKDKADDIDRDISGSGLASRLYQVSDQWNETLVYEFYHKRTPFLSKGRYVKMTEGVILESRPLAEKCGHDELPVARLTNIDVPGLLHGQSFLDQILLLQVMFNNIASVAYNNLSLGAHLYWLVPTQANVDIKKIKNGSSVIRYNGGFAPQIARFQTIGDEIFKMAEFVDREISRTGAVQDISRGEVPPQVEAGIAMAFLEEQENQRANTDIKKHNAFIKKLARLGLATAGAMYKAEDGRTMRIVGKNNVYSVKALDVAKLGGPYDIRVQRTTALSESKSGRLSQILALASRFPDKLPWEQVADMLDLANDQKFYSIATVAVQAAERENEMMAEGLIPEAPQVFEEHLVHWYTLVKYMQTSAFKEDMPEERKRLFIEHGMAHEFFMWEKADQNPSFRARLLTLENFPCFMPAPAPPPMPTPGMPPTGTVASSPELPPEEQAQLEPGGATPEPVPMPEPVANPGPVPPEEAETTAPIEEM